MSNKRKQYTQLNISDCFKKNKTISEDSKPDKLDSIPRRFSPRKKSPVKTKPMAFAAISEASTSGAAVKVIEVSDDDVNESDAIASLEIVEGDDGADEMEDDGGMSQDTSTLALNEKVAWKGAPLNEMKPPNVPLPRLVPSKEHWILICPHIDPARSPRPYPHGYKDKWDTYHVRMPCSTENVYPMDNKKGKKQLMRRWDMIENCLRRQWTSVLDIEEAILTYNPRFSDTWDFTVLTRLLTEELPANKVKEFIGDTLPKLVNLALDLPNIVTKSVPLLKRYHSGSLTLSQRQISCLLANAFLCTFPKRNAYGPKAEFGSYPSINFNTIFAEYPRRNKDTVRRQMEKLKCLLHYFQRVVNHPPHGTVTFTRRALNDRVKRWTPPDWSVSGKQFHFRLHVTSRGCIEEEGEGMLQVDFANCMIGGGVLRSGCVQEEIRFALCPELICSRLFTERLTKGEAMIITGAECYSKYEGYADSFKWAGDYREVDHGSGKDEWGRWRTCITAIDATVFYNYWDQFCPRALIRELNKAYCGFADLPAPEHPLPKTVATGNWGCGAFGGDHQLKALLQMMVCAEIGKNIVYFTFGDGKLRDCIHSVYALLNEKNTTVAEVWQLIADYQESERGDGKSQVTLFDFIQQQLIDGYDITTSLDQSHLEDTVTSTRADQSRVEKTVTCNPVDQSKVEEETVTSTVPYNDKSDDSVEDIFT